MQSPLPRIINDNIMLIYDIIIVIIIEIIIINCGIKINGNNYKKPPLTKRKMFTVCCGRRGRRG